MNGGSSYTTDPPELTQCLRPRRTFHELGVPRKYNESPWCIQPGTRMLT